MEKELYKGGFIGYDVDKHFLVTETRDHSVIIFQEQYRALRTEILQRQQRRFIIVLGGILGVPSLSGISISDSFAGDIVFLAPIIVVAVSYLFVLENNSIARAGHFIEVSVENYFKQVPGWEHYLHHHSDKYLKNSAAADGAQSAFKILMILYFLCAVGLAISRFYEKYPTYADTLGTLYLITAAALFLHWLWTTRSSLAFSAQLQKARSGQH